jgi:putative photosynthetic complex assembly protein 2
MTITGALIPFLFTIFVWWFSTGFILWLDRLAPKYFKWIMACSTLVLLSAFWGLYISGQTSSTASAYCAFTCALLIWAWQEIAFLLGYVTGSRRTPCPEGARGWQRARYAFEALNHHELALLLLFIGVMVCSFNSQNMTGFWTFVILWLMRQSAKLNIFFGVLNLNENFLPKHLKYLQTYFRRRSMNYLMPISIITSCLIVIPLWSDALIDGPQSFDMVSKTILATLLSLAIVEHLFLVLPVQIEFLWKWGFRQEG